MTNNKTGFWRGFTWRRWFKGIVYWFTVTLIFYVIWNCFDPAEKVDKLFSFRSLTGGLIKATLIGLLFTIWYEPGVDGPAGNPSIKVSAKNVVRFIVSLHLFGRNLAV